MKIVHICLAASYIEGYGYQENILTQWHKKMGFDVTVFTSDRIFNNKYERVKRDKYDYVNNEGVHVRVLKRSRRYGYYSKFNDFDGLYKALVAEGPDIIFVHGGQFVALKDVIQYCKNNKNAKLFIDQHGDYYNMKVDNWKQRFVHYWIYGYWMRKAIPYTEKFWGVTPWRCEYLQEVYNIPNDKIDLLVMGGDDRYIDFENSKLIRQEIRSMLNISKDDFVIITGGKIDKTKNIHLLMQAVSEIDCRDLKLIVFGQPDEEMDHVIDKLSRNSHIRNIGWLNATKVYDYFIASDLAIFPGTHSVLWEQACSCGLPGVFKLWKGMQHVNVNGSAEFLEEISVETIKRGILDIFGNSNRYEKMKKSASEEARYVFSYKEIARKSIGL